MIRWLIAIAAAVAGILVLITLFLQPNDFVGCGDEPNGQDNCRKADAIIAISGGDTQARTAEAIKLYQNGWGDRLIFSGAAQDKSGPSNAAAMSAQALAAGVPAEVIDIEEDAATTQENAANSQTIFERNDIQSVILVTSGYHQRRASLEFSQLAQEKTIILNHPTDDKDWNTWWWLTPRGWWLAGGELAKIVVFYTGIGR